MTRHKEYCHSGVKDNLRGIWPDYPNLVQQSIAKHAQNGTETLNRRKIRLAESNAKCRYLKKIYIKKLTLRQVFNLSEAPSPPMTPYSPPPLHTVYLIQGRGEVGGKS